MGIRQRACAIMLLAMLPAPSSEGPSPAGRCGSECVEHVSEAGSAKEPPPSLEPSFDAWLHASFACSPVSRRMGVRIWGKTKHAAVQGDATDTPKKVCKA